LWLCFFLFFFIYKQSSITGVSYNNRQILITRTWDYVFLSFFFVYNGRDSYVLLNVRQCNVSLFFFPNNICTLNRRTLNFTEESRQWKWSSSLIFITIKVIHQLCVKKKTDQICFYRLMYWLLFKIFFVIFLSICIHQLHDFFFTYYWIFHLLKCHSKIPLPILILLYWSS